MSLMIASSDCLIISRCASSVSSWSICWSSDVHDAVLRVCGGIYPPRMRCDDTQGRFHYQPVHARSGWTAVASLFARLGEQDLGVAIDPNRRQRSIAVPDTGSASSVRRSGSKWTAPHLSRFLNKPAPPAAQIYQRPKGLITLYIIQKESPGTEKEPRIGSPHRIAGRNQPPWMGGGNPRLCVGLADKDNNCCPPWATSRSGVTG